MRVVALITIAACALAGGACSKILGIDDPTPAGGDGPGGGDGPPGNSPVSLAFSMGDFQINQQQGVRVRVIGTFRGGSTQDVTANAVLSSDNAAIATGAAGGLVVGVSEGTTTITANLGTAQRATLNVMVSSRQCWPVINEFQTGSGASPDDEFVEIYNPCTMAFTVDGWTLVYRAATSTSDVMPAMVTLAGELAPEAIRLYGGPAYTGTNVAKWTSPTLAQASGAVALRRGAINSGSIADSVAYGVAAHAFAEGTPVGTMTNGKSASRLPFDGRDDGNGMTDFMIGDTRTPNATNVVP